MFKTLFSLFLGMGVFCCTLLGQDAPLGDAPVVAEAAVTEVAASAAPAAEPLNTGDQAWMLACAAMVLLMTPGLAFFYGGLVGRKNVLSILMLLLRGDSFFHLRFTLDT
jgi:Amt family ammonium transporter